jgi:titin
VKAVNGFGESAYSNTASVTVQEPPQPPAAPDGLEAVLEDGPMVDLAWTDNATDETGYVIERSVNGQGFSLLANLGVDAAAFADTAVLGGNTYDYRVAAVNGLAISDYSNTVSVFVPGDETLPAAPSNLSASNITQTTLTLNWQDNSVNEAGFTIQRAQNNSFTKNMVEFDVGPGVTFYNDSGLTKNTKYFYRVLAFNNFNEGLGPFPWSPTLNVTTAK